MSQARWGRFKSPTDRGGHELGFHNERHGQDSTRVHSLGPKAWRRAQRTLFVRFSREIGEPDHVGRVLGVDGTIQKVLKAASGKSWALHD